MLILNRFLRSYAYYGDRPCATSSTPNVVKSSGVYGAPIWIKLAGRHGYIAPSQIVPVLTTANGRTADDNCGSLVHFQFAFQSPHSTIRKCAFEVRGGWTVKIGRHSNVVVEKESKALRGNCNGRIYIFSVRRKYLAVVFSNQPCLEVFNTELNRKRCLVRAVKAEPNRGQPIVYARHVNLHLVKRQFVLNPISRPPLIKLHKPCHDPSARYDDANCHVEPRHVLEPSHYANSRRQDPWRDLANKFAHNRGCHLP